MFDRIDQLGLLAERSTLTKSRQSDDLSWLENLAQGFGHIGVNYYRFLYYLVLAFKPAVALEIGTDTGIASAHMATAAATYGGHVIGIDLYGHKMTETVIPEWYKNYHFIEGDSTKVESQVVDIINTAPAGYASLGLVFQDSSHHYQESVKEWLLYSALMGAGAIWVCDDISPAFHDPNIDPPGLGMVQYFEALPGEKRIYSNLHPGNGVGVIVLR